MGPMKGGQGLLPNPPTGIVHKDEGLSHHPLSLFYFSFNLILRTKAKAKAKAKPTLCNAFACLDYMCKKEEEKVKVKVKVISDQWSSEVLKVLANKYKAVCVKC